MSVRRFIQPPLAILLLLSQSGCRPNASVDNQKKSGNATQHQDLPKVLGDWIVFADGVGRGDKGTLTLKPDGTFAATYVVEGSTDTSTGKYALSDESFAGEKTTLVTLTFPTADKSQALGMNTKRLIFDSEHNLIHDMLTVFYCRPGEIENAKKLIERPENPKTAVKSRELKTKAIWSVDLPGEDRGFFTLVTGDVAGDSSVEVVVNDASGFKIYSDRGKLLRSLTAGNKTGGHMAIGRQQGKPILIQFDTWGRSVDAFDFEGKSLWNYPTNDSGIDWVTPIRIDSQNTGYFIGYNGGGGLEFIGPDGKSRWTKPADWNVWKVASLSRDANSSQLAVCVGASENAIAFDVLGNQVKDYKIGDIGAVGAADLDKDGHDELLALGTTVTSGQNLTVLNLDGKSRWIKNANASDSLGFDQPFLIGNFGTAGRLLAVGEQGGMIFFRKDGTLFGKITFEEATTAAEILPGSGSKNRIVVRQPNRMRCFELVNP